MANAILQQCTGNTPIYQFMIVVTVWTLAMVGGLIAAVVTGPPLVTAVRIWYRRRQVDIARREHLSAVIVAGQFGKER